MAEDIFTPPDSSPNPAPAPHRRRPRYRGSHPRQFADKYKEHNAARHPATVAKVLAAGKTPAGTHRPVMVEEILAVLDPQPGEVAVDCTLGHGGHAARLWEKILPGGRLIGLDADPVELPKTEARLRQAGHAPESFSAHRGNFAGLPRMLASAGLTGVDVLLADLGVSSMQLDDPARGFSLKFTGPLDMRMNPGHGQSAADLLATVRPDALAALLAANADEPRALPLAGALAGRRFATTTALAAAIRAALPGTRPEAASLACRRVFQALRIAVNDEFSALEGLLRVLPAVLHPGGRAAILTFHSGEDRRVKQAFAAGYRNGSYVEIAREVLRAGPEEQRANPRSAPAKLRWVRRAGGRPTPPAQ